MRVVLALGVLSACTAEPTMSEEVDAVAKKKQQNITRIRMNGQSSDTILSDSSTGAIGFLNVGRDEINNTTALDFSYATPTSDPTFIVLLQGAGEIPNGAYTRSNTTAHLLLPSTPFPTNSCTVNVETAEFVCVEGPSIAFDLTWEQNGFAEVEERTRRREKIGPLTTTFNGSFSQRSALVNGTWNGDTAVDMSGHLLDTTSTTVIREIVMEMN